MKKPLIALFSFSFLFAGIWHSQVLGAFSDVDASHPHFDAIMYVQDQNIVNGYEDGSFKPDASINRAEFMKIVILAAVGQEPLEHAGQCFSDVVSGAWFYPFICYGERVSIVGGYADGSFKPGQNISFVEAAKIIGNALGDTEGDGTDVWYKPYVNYLSSNKAIPLEVSSFSQELTRGQMAEMIYRIHGKVSNKSSQSYESLSENPVSSSSTNTDTSVESNDWGFGNGNLPLGLNKLSTSPKKDYIYACNTNLNGGGAHQIGDWVNEADGTWTTTGKATVDGDNAWNDAEISIDLKGDIREISSRGVPTNHGTGNFPVSSSDDAYQYDRNPNSISEQSTLLSIPANPEVSAQATCTDLGVIGVAKNGVVLFNGLDGMGRDAAAYEIQDACDGHPERTGEYHYHNLSRCLEDDVEANEHSELLGYIIDGFGIYGIKGESGELMKNDNLDECHGHSHEIEWDGQNKDMYHYHMTHEYPYTIGCFKGTPVSSGSGASTGSAPQGGGSNTGGGPPAGALSSCSGKSSGTSCSFTDGPQTISGTCQDVPNGLACVPAGGAR
jgi:hypothetical protein